MRRQGGLWHLRRRKLEPGCQGLEVVWVRHTLAVGPSRGLALHVRHDKLGVGGTRR